MVLVSSIINGNIEVEAFVLVFLYSHITDFLMGNISGSLIRDQDMYSLHYGFEGRKVTNGVARLADAVTAAADGASGRFRSSWGRAMLAPT